MSPSCLEKENRYSIWIARRHGKNTVISITLPANPLIYRFHELVQVYGTTFKELIHEEFGDGIMSAIDFKMDLSRQPDPNGDRLQIILSGKYLPYKTY